MSRELTKMNLISIVQQLPKDDIEVIETYIKIIERENKQLETNWKELKKWLQKRKFVYNITGEDLDEDFSITEVLIKMCEIECGNK